VTPLLLITVARGLFAAYGVIALSALFPVQLQDLTWQLRVISNLANNAPLPLAGLGLLLLAQAPISESDQQTRPINQLLLRSRWAAVAAAAGFALLALLQLRVSHAFLQQSDALHLRQNQQLQQQFLSIRSALSASDDAQQLNRAAALLLPPDKRPSLSGLTIPRQRSLLQQQLISNDQRARRDLERQRGQRQAALVVDGLRNLLLCLVFSWSFFALRPRIDLRAWLNDPED